MPLTIGADAGLTPAAVVAQHLPTGQWRVLDELVAPPTGMGARKFGDLLNRLLSERYAPWSSRLPRRGSFEPTDQAPIVLWGDPAANARASTDEQTWLSVMQAVTGLACRPAPTNRLTLRLEAVRLPLTRLLDGQPGLIVSPTCKTLRKGFNSGYRLRRMQVGGSERFADEPDKNEFSHVHDALQYALLGGGGHLDVLGRRTRSAETLRQTRAIDDDAPGGEWLNDWNREGRDHAIG
ncbi:MAG: hypothetical protein H7840_18080 [Alphaproteobacteria bacterium]